MTERPRHTGVKEGFLDVNQTHLYGPVLPWWARRDLLDRYLPVQFSYVVHSSSEMVSNGSDRVGGNVQTQTSRPFPQDTMEYWSEDM